MRLRAVLPVLLAALLTVPPLAAASTPSKITARLAPPVITVGESSQLVAQVFPVRAGRTVILEQQDGSSWNPITSATTDASGRVLFAMTTDTIGDQTFKVAAAAQDNQSAVVSPPVVLRVLSHDQCSPATAPVDPLATAEARCLAAKLDRWHFAGLMGVGQQLNVSNRDFLAPLTLLEPQKVSVVGFDVGELALGETYQFDTPPLQTLLGLARDGAVLTASWHTPNPHTASSARDNRWHRLAALLNDSSPEAQVFWPEYDAMLALFLRLQTGDDGAFPPAAVVFRPFHEANGSWFWWGQPKPQVYRQVWAKLQARAASAGVHNILWAYSFSAQAGSWIGPPEKLVPAKVDLAGLDSYDPETGRGQAKDRFDLSGYLKVARLVPRMAITEAGPQGSARGRWNPVVISRTVTAARVRPAWAMLWFDDGTGTDGETGLKQISSLQKGPAWLRSCANALCLVRP